MKTLLAPLVEPKLGDLRCRCEFLWLPRLIDSEWRWLEMAIWEEVFYYPWSKLTNSERFWYHNSERDWRDRAKVGDRFDWAVIPAWSPTVWINT